LHLPEDDREPKIARLKDVKGNNMILDPADTPHSTSLWSKAFFAKCKATREEEHAVFNPIHGPPNPRVYDILPDMK
jgi:hypothetical protein